MSTTLRYVLAWVVLMVLAAASFGLSSVRLGAWSTPLAFGIAAVKAGIVLLAFMQFLRTKSSIRLIAGVGVLVFGLLVGFTTADVMTRDPAPLLARPPSR
jgi:caa(3)-type oxidase subunit IV